MSMLIGLLFVCLVVAIVWWAITQLPLPAPVRMIAVVFIAILCLVMLFNYMQPISLPHGRLFR